jgi:hypothetical protein
MLEGVPWRRAKGNGESDDKIGLARDETHDMYSIARQLGYRRCARSRLLERSQSDASTIELKLRMRL